MPRDNHAHYMEPFNQYPLHGEPDYSVKNEGNPYTPESPARSQRGEPYTSNLAGKSTLVSDSVEMTKRLKAFVLRSSAKAGRVPPDSGYAGSSEEINQGSNYKATFQ